MAITGVTNTVGDWTDTNGPNTTQDHTVYGTGTGFVSAESVILAAGKADFDAANVANLIPIGLVENANIQQNKALQQLFEIGSRRPFFIPGRHQIQAALSRVMFNGPSLMKALYYLQGQSATDGTPESWEGVNADDLMGYTDTPKAEDFISDDASDPLWINLASEFFNHPFGLAFLMKNMEGETYGGCYLEECFIQAHQFSIASQQTVLLENCSLRAAKLTPISAATFGTPSPEVT